jgi:hypothetical protein
VHSKVLFRGLFFVGTAVYNLVELVGRGNCTILDFRSCGELVT